MSTPARIFHSSTLNKYKSCTKNAIRSYQKYIRRNKLITEWVSPISQPVVLILQPTRSGGTMLLRLFDGHPNIHAWPRPLGFTNLGWPTDPANQLKLLQKSFSLESFNHTGFVKSASNLTQVTIPIYFDKKWQHSIINHYLPQAHDPRSIFAALITSGFNAWRNYQHLHGPKKWVMYHMAPNPNNQLDNIAEDFFHTYPDGHILLTTRNPLDWLASAINLKHSNNWTGKAETALADYIRYYQNFPLSDNRITILNFDQLVLEPKNILAKVCQNLGCRYYNHLETTTINGTKAFQNSSHNLQKSNKPDPSVLGHGAAIRDTVALSLNYQKAKQLFLATQQRVWQKHSS